MRTNVSGLFLVIGLDFMIFGEEIVSLYVSVK